MLHGLLDNTVLVDQLTDASTLRQCDKRQEGDRYTTYIMSDEALTRGSDWRSPDVGMALVLDRGFESQRDLQQALARVGRFGDRAVRVKSSHVELIDPKLNLQLKTRLINYLAPTETTKLTKQPDRKDAARKTKR